MVRETQINCTEDNRVAVAILKQLFNASCRYATAFVWILHRTNLQIIVTLFVHIYIYKSCYVCV